MFLHTLIRLMAQLEFVVCGDAKVDIAFLQRHTMYQARYVDGDYNEPGKIDDDYNVPGKIDDDHVPGK